MRRLPPLGQASPMGREESSRQKAHRRYEADDSSGDSSLDTPWLAGQRGTSMAGDPQQIGGCRGGEEASVLGTRYEEPKAACTAEKGGSAPERKGGPKSSEAQEGEKSLLPGISTKTGRSIDVLVSDTTPMPSDSFEWLVQLQLGSPTCSPTC